LRTELPVSAIFQYSTLQQLAGTIAARAPLADDRLAHAGIEFEEGVL
jgi:hypothetical protein